MEIIVALKKRKIRMSCSESRDYTKKERKKTISGKNAKNLLSGSKKKKKGK